MSKQGDALVRVESLKMAYGERVVMDALTFTVGRGDVFAIMGGSGTGKSTLLRHMIGLIVPAAGTIRFGATSFFESAPREQDALRRRLGVMYQQGALWSSMTLAENVALPMDAIHTLSARDRRELAQLKLELVGLGGFADYFPSDISGGMRKRAAIARAMALDPEILFLDEPSAGLDPPSSRRLDDLVLELNATFGTTIVFVTHELASIFAVADNSVFLDAQSRTMIAQGDPKQLLRTSADPRVQSFLTRGDVGASGAA